MAVEDGIALGILLGKLSKSSLSPSKTPDVLRLYELTRKERTTVNVEGAVTNRKLYHMDGPEADTRNEAFTRVDWDDPSSDFEWGWGNVQYLKRLMAFDTIAEAGRQFDEWVARLGDHGQ